jgi:glutamate-ammonia-ligase adenylyltransferase
MTDTLVASRLLAPDAGRPPPAAALTLARACERATYADLVRDLDAARALVARQWSATFGLSLET